MINERKLSKSELKKREDIIMKMKGNKRDLVKKYGKDAEAVMYGRATNMAKKKTENMRDPKITELIKDALRTPVKEANAFIVAADKARDAGKKEFEFPEGSGKMHKVTIKKDLKVDEDLESGQYGDPKVGNYDITSQNDNEASDIEALSAAGLEEAAGYIGDQPLRDLLKMGTADMNLWHVVKLIDAGIIDDSDKLKALKALDPSRKLDEDIDIGHEDNEPGMLQGDLYEIGKASMEIYAMLDDMEGQGEVDLPSWWQSKVYKAKEAIVGAAEYLDFELKEPAIDAVVDKVMPLDINVDPLGETVEDFITSVDDLDEMSNAGSNYGSNEDSNYGSNKNPESYSGLKKFVAEKLAKELKEGLPKGFFDKAMKGKDEVDEVAGYDRLGRKQSDDDKDSFKKRPQSGLAALLNKEEVDESFDSLAKKIDKQKGKSKKDAANIAGYIANIKRKGGGSGPTAKQKKRMSEDYDSLVGKLKKQGKSEKAAKAIAGAMASYKAKGGGKGPTAKQKKRAK